MERDCIISGGASAFLREKTFVLSDMYRIHVCDNCGMFANYNPNRAFKCKICDHTDVSQVEIPYACKLLFQELLSMCIAPKIHTK
jgi:DNA-directed RNA polymerase II subunit RPB2